MTSVKNIQNKRKPVAEELEKFTEKTGLSKTATVENALKAYIEQYNKTGKI